MSVNNIRNLEGDNDMKNNKMNDKYMHDMYDEIVEHEKQGRTPDEVASLTNLTKEWIEFVKEYHGKGE